MTELLFKLKKAGKCVGYMRIAPPQTGEFLWFSYREPDKDNWHLECPVNMKAFDSIHPWVCKDRTGRPVFEGDKITGTVNSETGYPRTTTGIVEYDNHDFCWVVGDVGLSDLLGIELIEDKS